MSDREENDPNIETLNTDNESNENNVNNDNVNANDNENDNDNANNNDNDNNNNSENKENNETNNTYANAQDNLAALELKDDYHDTDDIGVNIDDVDVSNIPPIDELRNRDDVKISELLDYVDRYQQKCEIYRAKLVKTREAKKENVKKHRGSVIDLHNRMFKKLIDTETDQRTELEKAQDTIIELQTEVKKHKLISDEAEAAMTGHADSFKSSQLQTFIETNATLEKEINTLKKKLKDTSAELQVEHMKHERTNDSHRKSISTLHTNMFKKLLDAEDDFEDKIDKLNDELSHKARALQMEKMKNEQSDKLRRDSIQTVHNNMLTKLLDAQAEHDEKEEKLQNEIKELKAQLRKEILRTSAQSDKNKEKYGTGEADDHDDDSDMSDLETTDQTRKSNVSKKKTQFDDLWDEADEPEAEIDRLKAHIEKVERELKEEKEKNVFIEKQRKDSIHNLHNNMFQKLLDAEFEYEEEIERLHKEKEELNEKIQFYEDAFDKMNKDNNESGHMHRNENVINPTQVIQLREEIKSKNEIIEENKQKIFALSQKIEQLEMTVEDVQKQRRGSVSFLSKQMMAKLLEAEEENEEQRADFKDKLQRLQKELEESKENAFNLEKTRRNSVTKVSQTMFHKLLIAEQTKKQMTATYEEKIAELEQKLAVERLKSETSMSKQEMDKMNSIELESEVKKWKEEVNDIKMKSETKEKQRRESFTQLQNSYWTKLLQAEDDHEGQIKKLKHEIINLQNEITENKKTIEWLTTSKLNLITECNLQMNDLRQAVTIYNKNQSSSWFG